MPLHISMSFNNRLAWETEIDALKTSVASRLLNPGFDYVWFVKSINLNRGTDTPQSSMESTTVYPHDPLGKGLLRTASHFDLLTVPIYFRSDIWTFHLSHITYNVASGSFLRFYLSPPPSWSSFADEGLSLNCVAVSLVPCCQGLL